jgi:hypothetical protein
MKKPAERIHCDDYGLLQKAVDATGISGGWIKLDENQRQFRADSGAILNYWNSNGTVFFQGDKAAAEEFRSLFLDHAKTIKLGSRPVHLWRPGKNKRHRGPVRLVQT